MKNHRLSPTLLLVISLIATTNAVALDPLSAINRSDPATVEWRVVGQCLLTPRVEHWIPLAWVETSPSGNFSFISGVPTSDGKTSVLRSAGLESSSSARILNFTNSLWRSSNIANTYQQQVCNVSDAMAPAMLDSIQGGSDCESVATISGAMRQLDTLFRAATPAFMTLAYDSGRDPGWLSGCRDKSQVEAATSANMRCITDMLSPSLQPGGDSASAAAQRNCIGRWGSLIPRQSREIGLTGPLASAKTAYRAMSTARVHLDRFPYPVDGNGKMQLAAPATSGSFRPGDNPLPSAAQPNSERRYGWIYWRKVSCCVGD
jgi:hypothetical protein